MNKKLKKKVFDIYLSQTKCRNSDKKFDFVLILITGTSFNIFSSGINGENFISGFEFFIAFYAFYNSKLSIMTAKGQVLIYGGKDIQSLLLGIK